jgi:transketolase
VTRGYDQLELALVSRFNLKVISSHAGVTPAADGPSQMALSDVSFFRALSGLRAANGRPLLYLLQPADANAAYALTLAMARREGPCYLRTHRPGVPFLYDDAERFEPGGHKVVERGKDVLIVTAGYMVHECRKAVQRLQENGVRPTLVDLYSIPFDEKALASLARENGGRVLTVEDNYRGGIGSAVSDALLGVGGAFAVRQMYVRRIPKSGRTPDDVLRYLGLSAADIIKGVARLNDLPAGPFGTAAETNSH